MLTMLLIMTSNVIALQFLVQNSFIFTILRVKNGGVLSITFTCNFKSGQSMNGKLPPQRNLNDLEDLSNSNVIEFKVNAL